MFWVVNAEYRADGDHFCPPRTPRRVGGVDCTKFTFIRCLKQEYQTKECIRMACSLCFASKRGNRHQDLPRVVYDHTRLRSWDWNRYGNAGGDTSTLKRLTIIKCGRCSWGSKVFIKVGFEEYIWRCIAHGGDGERRRRFALVRKMMFYVVAPTMEMRTMVYCFDRMGSGLLIL